MWSADLLKEVWDDKEAFVLDELLLDGDGTLQEITDQSHQARAENIKNASQSW